MNSGAEAGDCLKLCRKWAYKVKGIKDGNAKIICCDGTSTGGLSQLFHVYRP